MSNRRNKKKEGQGQPGCANGECQAQLGLASLLHLPVTSDVNQTLLLFPQLPPSVIFTSAFSLQLYSRFLFGHLVQHSLTLTERIMASTEPDLAQKGMELVDDSTPETTAGTAPGKTPISTPRIMVRHDGKKAVYNARSEIEKLFKAQVEKDERRERRRMKRKEYKKKRRAAVLLSRAFENLEVDAGKIEQKAAVQKEKDDARNAVRKAKEQLEADEQSLEVAMKHLDVDSKKTMRKETRLMKTRSGRQYDWKP